MDTQTVTEPPEVVDGQATEIALAESAPPATLFRTDDPVEVVEKATAVANALKDVIVKRGLFTMIQGKAHVQVEGWQLVGAMLGVTAVCVQTDEVDGGYKATVEARAADGRVIGRADALCTKHEKRGPWKSADDYARLSMAQTRATSKALKGPLGFVISMAGYATTPAEEMTFVEPDKEQTRPAVSEPEGIGRPAAESLFNAAQAASVNGQRLSMWLTQLGIEHEPIRSKGTAIAALAKLAPEQEADAIDWFADEMDKGAETTTTAVAGEGQ